MSIPIVSETLPEDEDFSYSVPERTSPPNRIWAEEASGSPLRGGAGPRGVNTQASQKVRLIFQGPQSSEETGPLFTLARKVGLDVWGGYLLNRRAAREMGSAALLLFVVLTFELLAWTMLFNVLVHSAQWRMSWRTLIALTLGGIFASGVFLFEKSFVTSDFSESQVRKFFAYFIRLLIIAGSALATAQPIELLVFGGAIETRLHEENVLAESVRQVEDIKRLQTKAEQKTEGQLQHELGDTVQSTDLLSAKGERDTVKQTIAGLQAKLPGARAAVERAANSVSYWQRQVGKARARLNSATPEDQRNAQGALRKAEANVTGAQNRRSAAAANLASLEEELRSATAGLGVVEGQVSSYQSSWQKLIDQKRNEEAARARVSETSLNQLKEWIKTVQSAAPGQQIRNPVTGRILYPKPADFTDRLRILDDLRNGKPPLWPSSSDEVRAGAVQLFGLEDPTGPDTPAKQKIRERLEQNADLFGRVYWVAFLMASVIPLLTVAFKLMMAGELRDYYSTQAQARAGNPGAIQVIRARGQRMRQLFSSDVDDGRTGSGER
jgi:hypothetical protein